MTTTSQIDSRTIIDQAGAEKLLGKGDMLFMSPEFMKPRRAQGVLVTGEEVAAVTNFLRDERAPQYNEEVLAQAVKISQRGGLINMGDSGSGDDDIYDDVVSFVAQAGKASASLLQRRFKVGYARAARLMDMLEENGVVGPADGAKPRAVLVASEGYGEPTNMGGGSAAADATGAEVGEDE